MNTIFKYGYINIIMARLFCEFLLVKHYGVTGYTEYDNTANCILCCHDMRMKPVLKLPCGHVFCQVCVLDQIYDCNVMSCGQCKKRLTYTKSNDSVNDNINVNKEESREINVKVNDYENYPKIWNRPSTPILSARKRALYDAPPVEFFDDPNPNKYSLCLVKKEEPNNDIITVLNDLPKTRVDKGINDLMIVDLN